MYAYDDKTKTLAISKVKDNYLEYFGSEVNTRHKIQINLLKIQQDSYKKFKEETIFEDMQYLCEQISANTKIKGLTLTDVQVEETKYHTVPIGERIAKGKQYYRVYGTFKNSKDYKLEKIELLRIPFMESYGVLNFDGKKKVMLNSLVDAEDITYDIKHDKLVVAFTETRLGISKVNNKGLSLTLFKDDKKDLSPLVVARALLKQENKTMDFSKYFTNSILIKESNDVSNLLDGTVDLIISNHRNILQLFKQTKYSLGPLRKSLNNRLDIKVAVGQKTSRDIVLEDGSVITRGTILSSKHILEIKKSLINEIYIMATPQIINEKLSSSVTIQGLHASMTVTDFVRETLRDYNIGKHDAYLVRDYPDVTVTLGVGTVITKDIMTLMKEAGVTEVEVGSMLYPFEQEIIGNYTIKCGEYFQTMPPNVKADDYIYYYGVEDMDMVTEKIEPDYLTVHDILALTSMYCRIKTMPELNETNHSEFDLVKRVNCLNETFSKCLRSAIRSFTREKRTPIENTLSGKYNSYTNIFVTELQERWKRELNASKLLDTSKDVNPISTLSQANQLNTITRDTSTTGSEKRSLAMGFYGRICPYTTPQGQKLGLVNTLSLGSIVEDGIIKTPYFRVVKLYGTDYCKISPKPEYLSVEEEQKLAIGDIMSLDYVSEDTFRNSRVIARIPDKQNNLEKVRVATVDSTSLQYVNAFPEQHISPITSLIPFASGDDGNRIQFGTSLISQSIYVNNGEVPRVRTAMYDKMFKYSSEYAYYAERSGIVSNIHNNAMLLRFDGDEEDTVIEVNETKILNEALITVNFRKGILERFEKGELLYDTPVSRDGFFSPGVNTMVAYMMWDGYNYEDSIMVSRRLADKFTSVSSTKEEYEHKAGPYSASVESVNYYKYIEKKGLISTIRLFKPSDKERQQSTKSWVSHGSRGILYSIEGVKTESFNKKNESTIYTAKLLNFDKLEVGDKLSGRHGNKGVCGKIEDNSNMPTFLNGQQIDMCLNPCGVVSRMNIGQNLDAHLGFICYLLGIYSLSNSFNGASLEDIKELMRFVYDMANTPTWEAVKEKYNHFPSGLLHQAEMRYPEVRKWENCFLPDGTALLYNPKTGKPYEQPVAIGMPYFLKIGQEVDDKLHARSGMTDEPYAAMTMQPPKGSSHGGGQKIGEMEVVGILSHGAAGLAYECLNTKSDNIKDRVNTFADAIGIERPVDESLISPRSAYILRYYLEAQGVGIDINDYPGISHDEISNLHRYDGKLLLKAFSNERKEVSSNSREVNLDDIED